MISSIKKLPRKALMLMGFYVIAKWAIIIGGGSYLYAQEWWKNEYFLGFPLLGFTVLGIKKLKDRGAKPTEETKMP